MTIRERVWAKASAEQKRAAAVGVASFVSRFYMKYDSSERNRVLQDQVNWLWAMVGSGAAAVGTAVVPATDDERFVPDVDSDHSAEASIGQTAALSVFAATAAVVGAGEAAELWDLFDECYQEASETEDDEAAYSAGLRSLRGLSADQMVAGLAVLNNMPRRSQHAKRVRNGFREAEAAIREFLAHTGPADDAVARMRTRLDQIDVPALVCRWKVT